MGNGTKTTAQEMDAMRAAAAAPRPKTDPEVGSGETAGDARVAAAVAACQPDNQDHCEMPVVKLGQGAYETKIMPEDLGGETWSVVDGVPRCKSCGYSAEDCDIHFDHHLCGKPRPPRVKPASNVRPVTAPEQDIGRVGSEFQSQEDVDRLNIADRMREAEKVANAHKRLPGEPEVRSGNWSNLPSGEMLSAENWSGGTSKAACPACAGKTPVSLSDPLCAWHRSFVTTASSPASSARRVTIEASYRAGYSAAMADAVLLVLKVYAGSPARTDLLEALAKLGANVPVPATLGTGGVQ